ncbi:unnamed protein product [Ilex paraguariensis]|uniref:CCT domain-containing protein n=1 Tax=Ilex paraguariensis TaxID=185542 RepID=A0ABC8S6F9_9AQUA
MSSDLFLLENSFFSDPFPPFIDSPIDHDIFPAISDIYDNSTQQNPVEETNSLYQIASTLLSSSPPSHQLENLSLCQTTHLANTTSGLANGYSDFSGLEIKTEECQVPIESLYGYGNSFLPHSYDGSDESAMKLMQRSYSSNSFDGKPSFLFQPRFDSLLESPNFQTQVFSSPENSFTTGQMRRVCSTGDLQKIKTAQTSHMLSSSPLATERSFMEEANFKVGRYSAEERKEKIHRYRAKRNQRNFNKTIKYVCRKTLADNRPRIRGRFARNDEAAEIPKVANFDRYQDEDDPWIDGFNEDEEGMVSGGPLYNSFVPTQFQYYG